jgi:hypothetical protein
MKETLLKMGVAASVAAGAFTIGLSPAQAVSFTTTNCDFSGAVICTEVLDGNDNDANLNSFIQPSGFTGITWKQWAKIEEGGVNPTDPNEGATGNFFTISYSGNPLESLSGTWSLLESYFGSGTPFVLAIKGANDYAYNYFNGTVFSGTWDTERLLTPGPNPQQPSISHATLYVADNFRPVPTPALLPGLVGMGLAALRKKRTADQDDVS